MSVKFDYYELKWPTDQCTSECKGLCGYCPVHEEAVRDDNYDWCVGPRDRWHSQDEKIPVYISTPWSKYPNIRVFTNNIQYGRGTMKTSVHFGHTFTHCNAGMKMPAVVVRDRVFGVPCEPCLLTVGGRCWRY